MHKCPNCGREYQGNFCPECGTMWEDERTCPECGTVVEGSLKFCPNCGHGFIGKTKPKKPSKIVAIAPKLHKATEYLPVAMFAFFALLLFALFAAPVAIIPSMELLGEKTPAESLGNMYQIFNGLYGEDIPDLKSVAIACVLIAAYALIIAIALLLTTFKKPLNYKRLSIFGLKVRFAEIFEGAACIIYLIFLIITSVIIAKISAFDGGLGLIAAGACVVTILVFSCIFFVLHVAAKLFEKLYLDKVAPELCLKARAEKYYDGGYIIAGLSAPVQPERVEETKTYKKAKDLARFRRSFAVVAWLYYIAFLFFISGFVSSSQNVYLALIILAVLTVIGVIIFPLPVDKVSISEIYSKKRRVVAICVVIISLLITVAFSCLGTGSLLYLNYVDLIVFVIIGCAILVVLGALIFIKKLRKKLADYEDDVTAQNEAHRDYVFEKKAYGLKMSIYMFGEDYSKMYYSKTALRLYRNRKWLTIFAFGLAVIGATLAILLTALA